MELRARCQRLEDWFRRNNIPIPAESEEGIPPLGANRKRRLNKHSDEQDKEPKPLFLQDRMIYKPRDKRSASRQFGDFYRDSRR